MASPTIQFKRGLIANLPALRAGEPGFTTDTTDFYVGGSDGNKYFGSHRYWGKEDGSTALRLKMVDKNGSNNISLKAPDTLAGVTTYTLPVSPTEGYFLKTNANGTLSWASVTASATFENAVLAGVTTITNADMQGGKINGTTVGLTTAAAAQFTTLGANSLNVSGIATVGSLSIGSTQVVSSAFQLQNIQSLDATTTATIEAAVANAPNTFTELEVTGISTFNGAVNLGSDSADIITVKGTTTFEQPVVGTISTATALQNARDFSITGDFITAPAISFNGTGNVAFAATLAPNSVALGTYTTGNYVATVAGTANQISVSGSGFETASVTLSLPSDVVVGTSLSAPTVKTSNVKAENGTAAITIDNGGNVGVSTNLTVSGNLFVNGTTTQVNTTSLTVEDTLVELGLVDGAAPGSDLNKDLGLVLNWHNGTAAQKAAIYWDDSVTRFGLASQVSESSSVLTAAAYAALEVGGLYVNNACTGGVQEVIGCANGELNLQNIVVDGGLFS
jgi:hypothetical protein